MKILCSLRVRLHPKPQMSIQYRYEDKFRLMQPNKVKMEVTNLSMHTYRGFKYPSINLSSFPTSIESSSNHDQIWYAVSLSRSFLSLSLM